MARRAAGEKSERPHCKCRVLDVQDTSSQQTSLGQGLCHRHSLSGKCSGLVAPETGSAIQLLQVLLTTGLLHM
jgi:hypothetical protein